MDKRSLRINGSQQNVDRLSVTPRIFCSELVGGILSGSLAILTDAAHQLSDVAGFVISFVAMW